ncbi:hypothetical protein B7463_g5642, partial [Scytalidium lignicola]
MRARGATAPLEPSKESSHDLNPQTVQRSDCAGGLLPNLFPEDVTELVEHYLRFIHDKPHSLFHKLSLWNDIQDGRVSKALLYAICGLRSRFSRADHLSLMGPELTAKSKRLFQSNLVNVSLENIQTCVLFANLCATELETESEALYFGIAIRMSQIMGLHKTNPDDNLILREIKARVWWTLFMADRWCSVGLGLPRQIHDCKRAVDLPMDEYVFQNLHNEQQDNPRPLTLGLWAYMITLVEIFGPVQDLNRRLVEENVRDEDSDRCVQEFSTQLDLWQESLPPHLRLNERNLDQHKEKGLGGGFVALHLGYHHYATLLYFQYLDPQRTSTVMHKSYVNRCKFHASSYSALLKMSRDKGECEAVYATVGHMTLVSSSVLLYTLLFGDENELPAARENLSFNFKALVELKRYWPSLERTVNRLFTFQNSCLQSADTYTHKIDRWMVRFLLEHALPLDEKVVSLAVSPTAADFAVLSADAQRLSLRGRATGVALSGFLRFMLHLQQKTIAESGASPSGCSTPQEHAFPHIPGATGQGVA